MSTPGWEGTRSGAPGTGRGSVRGRARLRPSRGEEHAALPFGPSRAAAQAEPRPTGRAKPRLGRSLALPHAGRIPTEPTAHLAHNGVPVIYETLH